MIEKDLLDRLNFSALDKEYILSLENSFAEEIEKEARLYWEKKESFPHYIKSVRKTHKEISPYTMDLLFILHLTSFLKLDYIKQNIPEEIYWNTVMDIKYKADECKDVKHVVGTFVAEWFEGFFKLTRFALGRLQFDVLKADEKIETKNKIINKGDSIFSCHIPSGSKLDYNDCIKSYKKAYEFFSGKIKDTLPVICISWLLYPDYKAVFQNCPNTKRFIEDFEIYKVKTQRSFEDSWRVFSTDDYRDVEALPQETSMQRAFKEHIKNKGKFGYAFGVLLFDGEKVI